MALYISKVKVTDRNSLILLVSIWQNGLEVFPDCLRCDLDKLVQNGLEIFICFRKAKQNFKLAVLSGDKS